MNLKLGNLYSKNRGHDQPNKVSSQRVVLTDEEKRGNKSMPEKELSFDEKMIYYKIGKQLSKTMANGIFPFIVADYVLLEEFKEDPGQLSGREVIDKIRDHYTNKPSDFQTGVFLQYLSYYPVSMCKKNVSPFLRFIIGFHYRMAIKLIEENEDFKALEKTSYDDLAKIFGRSKATIHACVNDTNHQWNDFLQYLNMEERVQVEAIK